MNTYEAKIESKREYYQSKADAAAQEASRLWEHWETWDRASKVTKQAEYYQSKAESVGTGGISSDDPDAVQKITAKIERLKNRQNHMKAVNKAIRIKDTEKGNAELRKLGLNDEQIQEVRKPDFIGRVGYPAYELSNNNAEIHRLEKRLVSLQNRQEREENTPEIESANFTYKVEDGRFQFIFQGKPAEEVRNILKGHAFKWSPSRTAWVRQNTGNGAHAARQVLQELKNYFGE